MSPIIIYRLKLVGLFSLQAFRESRIPTKSVRDDAYNVVCTTAGMLAIRSLFRDSPITFTTKPVPKTHYPSQCSGLGKHL